MGPLLRSLIHLQQIEIRVRETRTQLQRSQKVIKRQEHTIAQNQAALEAKREEIKLTRIRTDQLEVELKAEEDEISKLRVQLNTAKTNKEYSAILTRLNTDKADKTKLEEQILQLMNLIETNQLACKEIENQMAEDRQKLEESRTICEDKQAQIKEQLTQLGAEYEQAASEVPDKEREMFERLSDRYDGEVMVEVRETSRKGENNCGGCYMSIPLELVNSLMTRDEVVMCPSCGRVLALDLSPSQPTA